MIRYLILSLLLSSCASQGIQQLNPEIFYKRDMTLNVNGIKGEGTLVIPRYQYYNFDVIAHGDLDLFTLDTCHREIAVSDAGDHGIFGNKRHVNFNLALDEGIETGSSCPVRMGGYEKIKGRHSWALVDFEDEEDTLPAEIKCNGVDYSSNGVTVCQSKEYLLQQIIFEVPVVVSPTAACPMPDAPDKKTFTFPIAPKECVYAFTEIAQPHRTHRLTTLGYAAILLR